MLSVQFGGPFDDQYQMADPLFGCTMYIVANASPLLARVLVTLRCCA
jgi:hypothetical protein